jgi:ribonuclease Z
MAEPAIQKSFLAQRFAKLSLGAHTVIGYSVAGEESVVQIPELNVCFDIGRCPYFALTSDYVCITHAHMDHIAGLPYYLSQRNFQGMKPGTVFLPADLSRGVDDLLKVWRAVERQGTPYTLVPMFSGELHEIRRDFAIRAIATHHGGSSLGYSLISIREKLKPEYLGTPGPELAALRRQGVEIQYRIEIPLVTYLGDTAIGPVFDHPDVINAEILITELTFFEPDHRQRAKVGRHLHIEDFINLAPNLKNKWILLSHVSRRTGLLKAKRLLKKRLSEERLKNILFLMDLHEAHDAGEVEAAGPPLVDSAE